MGVAVHIHSFDSAGGFYRATGNDPLTWLGTTTAGQALAITLTGMMRNGEVRRARAEEIATTGDSTT